MTPFQLAFLALVFIVVEAGFLGISALIRPNAARQRLTTLVADASERPHVADRWMRWVADLTRPISKLKRWRLVRVVSAVVERGADVVSIAGTTK